MVKGMYHHIRKLWRKPDKTILKKRMVEWRKQGSFNRVEKPLRLDRARALGYKAKKGVIIIRVKIKRGGHKRSRPNKGRRSKRLHTRKNLKMSYKWIAEQRVDKKYPGLVVLNSYAVGKDGMHYFYEVITLDPKRPEIKSDKQYKQIIDKKYRAVRGLTSAAKKSRGLRSKHPASKVRPSVRAGGRKGK